MSESVQTFRTLVCYLHGLSSKHVQSPHVPESGCIFLFLWRPTPTHCIRNLMRIHHMDYTYTITYTITYADRFSYNFQCPFDILDISAQSHSFFFKFPMSFKMDYFFLHLSRINLLTRNCSVLGCILSRLIQVCSTKRVSAR